MRLEEEIKKLEQEKVRKRNRDQMDAAMARVAGELIINHIEKAITEIYDEQTRLLSREKQQEELAKEM